MPVGSGDSGGTGELAGGGAETYRTSHIHGSCRSWWNLVCSSQNKKFKMRFQSFCNFMLSLFDHLSLFCDHNGCKSYRRNHKRDHLL